MRLRNLKAVLGVGALLLAASSLRAGTIYIAQDSGSDNIATASAGGGTASQLTALPASTDPHQIVIGGSVLFVAEDSGASTVGEYNLGGSLLGNITTAGTAPVGVAVQGDELYVASYGGQIGEYAFDPTTGAIGASNGDFLTLGSGLFSLAADSTDLFIADQSLGTVIDYNLTTHVKSTIISGLTSADGLAISGSDLYVSSTDMLGEYALTGGTALQTLSTGTSTTGYTPLYLTVYNNDLYATQHSNTGGTGSVGEYSLSLGTVNSALVTGLTTPYGLAIAVPAPNSAATLGSLLGLVVLGFQFSKRTGRLVS